MKPILDANEWMQIVAALKSKMESLPPQQAAYLREINDAIIDGEQASLNEQDWAEIYCALADGACRQLFADSRTQETDRVHQTLRCDCTIHRARRCSHLNAE